MSDQNTLSRRRALSLLGATALTAQTAAARSQDVVAAATSTRPRYIFGYGSLIERESRMATWPSAQFAYGSIRPKSPAGARPTSVGSQKRTPKPTA